MSPGLFTISIHINLNQQNLPIPFVTRGTASPISSWDAICLPLPLDFLSWTVYVYVFKNVIEVSYDQYLESIHVIEEDNEQSIKIS